MDKIIVYGIGTIYSKYKKIIDENYEIIGYCDKNEEKVKDRKIKKDELVNMQDNCDFILITSVFGPSIYPELVELGIKKEKIKIISFEPYYFDYWYDKPEIGNTYSGSGEDIIISSLLREKWKIQSNEVNYIELGVNDPVLASNTFYFYEHGSKGILVEANPNYIEIIKEIRSKDVVINSAIYSRDNEEISFYISDCPGLSSLKKDHLSKGDGWKQYNYEKEIKVKTITINSIFKMIDNKCDLLSIDLEGYDLEALMSINFIENRPKVIIAELNWDNTSERKYYQRIVDLLKDNGYVAYFYNKYNGIFYDGKA